MFCLLLNGNKACNLQQLKEFFDFDIVEMYLLGGSLPIWLEQCGEDNLAQLTREVDLNGNISLQLSEIFNVKLPESLKTVQTGSVKDSAENNKQGISSMFEKTDRLPASFELYGETEQCTTSSFEYKASKSFSTMENPVSFEMNESKSFAAMSSSFGISSFGELNVTSFEFKTGNSFSNQLLSSFEQSSFNIAFLEIAGSFFNSSFNLGSFGWYEYEYEYNFGSSFSNLYTDSFNTEWLNTGSFSIGSFILKSEYTGSLSSADFFCQEDTAANQTRFTALPQKTEKIFLPRKTDDLPPEEKIKQNILSCPLNRFGYGIHLI